VAKSNIRVLVVDDSAVMRKLIRDLIEREPGFEVVGVCRNGQEGVERARQLRPDVVTMDVEMPVMDGLAAVRAIMAQDPVPVVMLSGLTAEGAEVTLRALNAGAVDFVRKPSGTVPIDIARVAEELTGKLRAAALSNVRALTAPPPPTPQPRLAAPRVPRAICDRVVAIGTSTGGPRALQAVVPRLPGDLPAAVLIVQHMPPRFTKSLADRLNSESALTVKEAEPGDEVRNGMALVAPGDYHMRVANGRRIELTQEPPLWGVRPAVDIMVASAADVFGARTLGVVMTGMGHDGRDGCGVVRRVGGRVIAEDESTCVIFGMPRAVQEAGYATAVVPLDRIAQAIVGEVPKL